MIYDLIIIGGGPAGAAAGVYSARKKLKTLIIADSFGGQSLVSDSIENWIGVKKMAGFEFSKMLEAHIRAQKGVEIKMPERVDKVIEAKNGFRVETNKNTYQAKTLIIASGSRRKELNIPGEKKFKGKGVAYCSTCDAPVFKDKVAAVVGGGNSAFGAAIDLIPYAKKIYLLNRSGSRADPLIQKKTKKSSKVIIINNVEIKEILGDPPPLGGFPKGGGFVSGLKYLDKKTNKIKKLAVEGIFVEIGTVPNSEIFKNLVKINAAGEIIVNRKTMATNHPGIFAAGDITDEIYKQNNISAGDGVIAALSAYNYLLNIKKQ